MIFTGLPVANADALLPSALAKTVKLRSVEQFAEDQWNLLLENAGTVVLHANLETVVSRLFNVHPDFRQDAGFFTRVERVVDGLGLSKPSRWRFLAKNSLTEMFRWLAAIR
jgi:hypothetical protein